MHDSCAASEISPAQPLSRRLDSILSEPFSGAMPPGRRRVSSRYTCWYRRATWRRGRCSRSRRPLQPLAPVAAVDPARLRINRLTCRRGCALRSYGRTLGRFPKLPASAITAGLLRRRWVGEPLKMAACPLNNAGNLRASTSSCISPQSCAHQLPGPTTGEVATPHLSGSMGTLALVRAGTVLFM